MAATRPLRRRVAKVGHQMTAMQLAERTDVDPLANGRVAGSLGERLLRQRLRPSGWDALESPLIMAALGLSVGMAALGNMSKGSGTNPKHPLVAGS